MSAPLSSTAMPVDFGPDRDAQTVRLLAARDPEGLRRLLSDHGLRVQRTLRKDFHDMLDDSEIDDAISQASQRIWRTGERIDLSRGTLRAWFYVIARNCAVRIREIKNGHGELRYVSDMDNVTATPANTPPGAEAADEARRAEFARQLHRCIDRLPPQQRAVIRADLVAGGVADTTQLVQQLRTTANSIYVARTNGRKALRTALEKLGLTHNGLPAVPPPAGILRPKEHDRKEGTATPEVSP